MTEAPLDFTSPVSASVRNGMKIGDSTAVVKPGIGKRKPTTRIHASRENV
jgi:hypothetical protein